MILSLGSGKQAPAKNLVRVDISESVNPDVVWDLAKVPYPFDDKSFSEIQCFDILEHVENVPAVVEECYRLLSPGGVLKITTPHFSCSNSYIDPTHRYHFSYFSMDCFTTDHKYSYYSKARFQFRTKLLHFEGSRLYCAILRRIANRFPEFYEKKLTWILPAWFSYFELEAKK